MVYEITEHKDKLLVEYTGTGGKKRYNNGTKIRVAEAVLSGQFKSLNDAGKQLNIAAVTVGNWVNDYQNGVFDDLAKNTNQVIRKPINHTYITTLKQEIKEKEALIELAEQANKLGVKIEIKG